MYTGEPPVSPCATIGFRCKNFAGADLGKGEALIYFMVKNTNGLLATCA